MKRISFPTFLNRIFLAGAIAAGTLHAAASSYLVIASEETAKDPEWAPVVQELAKKHSADILILPANTSEEAAKLPLDPAAALPALQKSLPKYTCFVAKPSEATKLFVQRVHQTARKIDSDPWPDTFWGILTGYDAANALQIVRETAPLEIHKVGSGTEIAMDRVESGAWFCELKQGLMVQKTKGGEAEQQTAPPDTTETIVNYLNNEKPDLWIQSGHGTERDWMIGFTYQNGFLKSDKGELFGQDTKQAKHVIHSDNPKVFLPVGNCLIGHIDGPDAIALAYMKTGGARQMIGYIDPTWYGFQGWGMLDYFVEQPGRFTVNEAFFANQIALLDKLSAAFPGAEAIGDVDGMGRPLSGEKIPPLSEAGKAAGASQRDAQGLLFDRDHVTFYGDPAWSAKLAPGVKNWDQKLEASEPSGDGTRTFTLTITPLQGEKSFQTVSNNGSERGGRPIIEFLSDQIAPETVKLEAGQDFEPKIADSFILVPQPKSTSGEPFEIKFSAKLKAEKAGE